MPLFGAEREKQIVGADGRLHMWDVILDALADSAKALPFLLAIYLFIEFLESSEKARDKTVKLLNGRLAPLVAGGVGLIPQCGFSVMATDLYCQNYLKTGTLIAFFVATSDEALPLLLTNPKTIGVVWIVAVIKVVYAVALGYVINAFDRRTVNTGYTLTEKGCCHHDMGDEHPKRTFWQFVRHPLLHTLKIFLYIFAVNVVFGLLLYYASDAIMQAMTTLGFWQCLIVPLVGLVPNCASSVIITGMYTQGIITFSAMLAGLVSNSGIALAILFRQRNFKRNMAVVGIMYAAGAALGAACYFLLPLFTSLH